MNRRRMVMLFLPALLIILLAAAFSWVLRSESGARWLLERTAAVVPGELTFESLTGDLQSGVRIGQISYRDEGLTAMVDELATRVDLDFWPPAVSVHYLQMAELSLRTATATEPREARSLSDTLAALSLPVPLEFRRVRAERLTWYAGAEEPRVDLRGLSFAGHWFRQLELQKLEVSSGDSQLKGQLAFGFEAPHSLALQMSGQLDMTDIGESDGTLDFSVDGSGDLLQSGWQARIAEPRILASATLRDLLGTPGWDLQLTAGRLQWPVNAEEPVVVMQDAAVSTYGTAADYGIEIDAAVSGDDLPRAQAHLVGTGDRSGLEFEVLELMGDEVQVDGGGRLGWDEELDVAATLDVVRFSPRRWIAEWGEADPLSGGLTLAWSDKQIRFGLQDLAAPGSFEVLRGSVTVDPSDGAVVADLEWRDLAWPPGSGAAEPIVRSREGQARLSGQLDRWTVSGELGLSGPDFPAGRLRVEGGGDTTSLRFSVPQAAVLGGNLQGEFEMTWSPEVLWAASARVQNLATAPLAPDFAGRISGEFAVRGRPEQDALEIEIGELAGMVRQRNVQARGDLVIESGRTRARDLWVRSGQSEVTLNGRMDKPEGLAFNARIDSLADLVDGASGVFAGNGLISLAPAQPVLRLQGEGHDLQWGDTAIGYLHATSPAGRDEVIQLEMTAIEFGSGRIETLAAEAGGTSPLENLSVQAELADSRVELRLAGRIEDWTAPLGSGWSGQLQELRLDTQTGQFIELEQAVGLKANAAAFVLQPACFRGDREGRLCLEATWRPQGERVLRASLDDVSPNLAMTLLESDLVFTQRLSGVLEWRQHPRAHAAARVDLEISPGEMKDKLDDEHMLRTGSGRFGFEVAAGRLHSGNLDIPITGGGNIDSDFSVPDLSAGMNSPVQGRLQVNLTDIAPLMRLIPGVEGSSGPVTADMSLSGSLNDPKLTGHASLVRGTLSHFASGLVLEDIQLAGAVYQYGQTELTGSFRAGSGRGSIRSVLNFQDVLKPELLLQIQGDNLTLVNVPDLNVTANPDVRLVWREGTVNIEGRIVIPAARLSPRYLPTSATTESADVVIVAGEDPLAVPQQSASRDWRLRGALTLELGDDVQLLLDRAKTQVRGSTTFSWQGAPIPVADGSFSLTGEIHAYGQLLKVTEGRVNFSNRPADNPFLNIRAEREIYGNSQVTRAGVLVTGTLKEPILEPYSVPMTNRERALALLVTGSDFNYEQGVGTVEVGMYIAPKLFISYGIGLFDDQSVISARYDLGRGFGIKTTSGQRESGADITYTIER